MAKTCLLTQQEYEEHISGSKRAISGIIEEDTRELVGIPKHLLNYEQQFLEKIAEGALLLGAMHSRGGVFLYKAFLAWAEEHDLIAFKHNCYIRAKLLFMSFEPNGVNSNVGSDIAENIGQYFWALMSDSPELRDFIVLHRQELVGDDNDLYAGKDDLFVFLNNNLIIALAGDWARLKRRALQQFNDLPPRQQFRKYDQAFFLALAEQDIAGMQAALGHLLDIKIAKRAVKDCESCVGFYFQTQVLMYAKLAAIHGFDLGIDEDIAPKQLIQYTPLDSYSDPYDFMQQYDYKQPLQQWVDYCESKNIVWRAKKKQEEEATRKPLARIKRFFGL